MKDKQMQVVKGFIGGQDVFAVLPCIALRLALLELCVLLNHRSPAHFIVNDIHSLRVLYTA